MLNDASLNTRVEITGDWKTECSGTAAREVISPRTGKKAESTPESAAARARNDNQAASLRFIQASFDTSEPSPFSGSLLSTEIPVPSVPLAPIRVTSPGLTVYKGGVVTPRLYLINQHLGSLNVSRQMLDVSVSYTPTPRLQLEVEVPASRTSFDDGVNSGSGVGLGNITLWGKYRFYRTVKTYGDRQAAVRFGLELPTGKRTAPTETEVNAPAFVRQQFTPINGGLSPHLDVALSQAGGRFIFGGNVEAILRSERDGYRLGHEVRVNTDLEYVLLPRDYEKPGGELFLILETTFVQRGRGRVGGITVEGSKSTEYYLAPGLQYAAAPQFVIEGSYQFPVVRNAGPLVLKNDRNILLGIRYLF
jgi:Putative MetA-pathway of phenol degradation